MSDAVASAAHSEHIPDVRISGSDDAASLFEQPECDKLIPLLEAGKLDAWARPMGAGTPPLVRIPQELWRTHQLHCLPRGNRPGLRNQTFLKSKIRQETKYYDVFLNSVQILRIWPSLKLKTAGLVRSESPPSPPINLALKWIPSAGTEDIVAVCKVEPTAAIENVSIIGRYAEAIHYLTSCEWKWVPSVRLNTLERMVAPESMEIEAIRRPRDGRNFFEIFKNFSLDIKEARTFLIRLDVVSDSGGCFLEEAFYVTPSKEGKVLQHIHMDHLKYIKGRDLNSEGAGGDEED